MKQATDIVVSDTFELVKEWQSLEREGSDLEFRKQQYARKVRQRFAGGTTGDRQFRDWCIVSLKMDEAQSALMRTLAIAGSVFDSASAFKQAGSIASLSLLYELEPSEQESILRTAKAQGERIGTIWRRRHANPASARTPTLDARRLAEYLAKHNAKLPTPIREIVARYVRIETKRPTA